MPARKPTSLNSRNTSKELRAEREAAESAMRPKTELMLKPPMLLNNRKIASETWKEVIKNYREVDGIIATAFDKNVLTTYCILVEECIRFEKRRDEIDKLCSKLIAQINEFKKKKLTDDEYKILSSLYVQLNALSARVQGADARLDGKRKLVYTLEQSLYLTPRSRAGVAPPEKEPEESDDPMDQLLNG